MTGNVFGDIIGDFVGDVKSHLFAINSDTTYEFFSDDGGTVRTVDGKTLKE